MEDFMPVGIVKTADRVPKDSKGVGGGSGTVRHDGNMVRPVKFMVNEDTKVVY